MSVRLIGANPGLTLFDAAGERTAFASVWRVDWSERGPGQAVVVWQAGEVRILTPRPELGQWLTDEFTRHFPEVAGLPWGTPAVTHTAVRLDYDLARGIRAQAADVVVEIDEPLDRRLIRVPEFDLGGTPNLLSTVYVPCAEGRLTVDGVAVAGSPQVTHEPTTSSSAFLADAEVWCRVDVPS